jgi:hypothetical protein
VHLSSNLLDLLRLSRKNRFDSKHTFASDLAIQGRREEVHVFR